MKKFFMVLALASVSVAGMAQNETPELKYSVATNSFWSNWFVQANVAYEMFYSDQEDGKDFSKSPFKGFRSNISPSVAVGKWFTPSIGLRTKLTGFWGRSVSTEDASTNAMKFMNLQEQVMLNVSNLVCGYNPNRLWNLIPYAGYGLLRNFDENENCHGISLGLLNTWKLNNKWAVNLDLGFNLLDDDVEGLKTGHSVYGTSIAKADRYFTAEVGVTYNLGKGTWNKMPDLDAIRALHQSEIDALNSQLNDVNAEVDRLNNLIKNHKCPEAKTVTIKEVAAAPVSVFFNLGSAKLASKKDLVNLQAIADMAKANNKVLIACGSADSKTGGSAYNQTLSEQRAETVKSELVKLGVPENMIEVKAVGGVDEIEPYAYNRRAVVSIK